MEAVRTYETSVYYNETTRRNIPEGYHLHARRRENLNSHFICLYTTSRYFLLTLVYFSSVSYFEEISTIN
jgi:hypothetical protein